MIQIMHIMFKSLIQTGLILTLLPVCYGELAMFGESDYLHNKQVLPMQHTNATLDWVSLADHQTH